MQIKLSQTESSSYLNIKKLLGYSSADCLNPLRRRVAILPQINYIRQRLD